MAAEGLEIGDCKIRENREGYVGDLAKVSTILIDFSLTCKGGNFYIHVWAWFGYFIC